MNNSKIWLVVSPTVGVPLFLSAVAVGSFAVHVAVVSNTDWVSDFLQGDEMGAETAAITSDTSHAALDTGDRIKVTLPDGSEAWAVIEAPRATMASAILKPAD